MTTQPNGNFEAHPIGTNAEVEALRAALAEIAALPNYRCVAADMRKIARKALGAKP